MTDTAHQHADHSRHTDHAHHHPAPADGRGGVWHAASGAVGVVSGLAPHVLHHAGILAGTALVAGAAGTALFGTLGLLASVPMLLRLHRRFGTWIAPGIGLAVFTAMFAVSAFVIGPAINGDTGSTTPGPQPTVVDHNSHH